MTAFWSLCTPGHPLGGHGEASWDGGDSWKSWGWVSLLCCHEGDHTTAFWTLYLSMEMGGWMGYYLLAVLSLSFQVIPELMVSSH